MKRKSIRGALVECGQKKTVPAMDTKPSVRELSFERWDMYNGYAKDEAEEYGIKK